MSDRTLDFVAEFTRKRFVRIPPVFVHACTVVTLEPVCIFGPCLVKSFHIDGKTASEHLVPLDCVIAARISQGIGPAMPNEFKEEKAPYHRVASTSYALDGETIWYVGTPLRIQFENRSHFQVDLRCTLEVFEHRRAP